MKTLIENYLRELYGIYSTGSSTEGSFYAPLREFLRSAFKTLGYDFEVISLPERTTAGYPDGKVIDKAEVVGYFECKDLGKRLEDYLNTSQLERYLQAFENLIFTNFIDFWFFRKGNKKFEVSLISFSQLARGQISVSSQKVDELERALREFSTWRVPAITTMESLAEFLAGKTALLKEKIVQLLSGDTRLQNIYQVFKERFIKNLTEEEFGDTLAQAFVYSLLIGKLYTPSPDTFDPERVLRLIPEHLQLIRDFYSLLYSDIRNREVEELIKDMVEVLNKFDPRTLFSRGLSVEDLITHFYEPFLRAYNPELSETRGVFYTPNAVVSFIVRSVDEILKESFGLTNGVGEFDKNLKFLDPAGGTLTFITYLLDYGIRRVSERYGEGAVKNWLENYALENIYAFELLPSAYTIGHLRISAFLKKYADINKRFKLYLTNTLELEHEYIGHPMGLLRDMEEETKEADRIKKEEPIMVITGNPPYSGISANMKSEVAQKLREDWNGCQSYYKVDGKPLGEKKLWLQDDYVKFIRFGQWKIHRAGRGILAYITNHAYIDNITYRGMRQSLLKTFDKIYILNLHGNARRKEEDQNVFDIQQGVAIGIFVKDGSKEGEYARVYYASVLDMGFRTRKDKYDFLSTNSVKTIKWIEVKPQSPYYFFVPLSEVKRGQSIIKEFRVSEIFKESVSGIITSRDPLVIGFTLEELKSKLAIFGDPRFSDDEVRVMFFGTRRRTRKYPPGDTREWKLSEARRIIQADKDWDNPKNFQRILYRPFDIRWIYYVDYMVDWGRWDEMKHLLAGENVALITTRQVAEGDFTHAYCAKTIVESRITLSNRGVAYILPIFLYNSNSSTGNKEQLSFYSSRQLNYKPEFLEFITSTYPGIAPEDFFYYIYAVLYSNLYRQVYAEDLTYNFPSIPFFSNTLAVKELITYGKELVRLHTQWENSSITLGRFPVSGDNVVSKDKVRWENQRVWINDRQYFEGIPEEVWNYVIGAYRVLEKWLKERDGRQIDPIEFMRIAGAISKTIELQERIDEIIGELI